MRRNPLSLQASPLRSQRSANPEREALEAFNRRLARRRGGGFEAPRPRPPAPPPPEGPSFRPPSLPTRGCANLLAGLLTLLVAGLIVFAIVGFVYWQVLEERGPIHVLLLGIDERPQEQGPFRSDTMMLAGFEPRGPRVALLSIPRDLWVTIPGIGENRVNTANFFGGPELAKTTVSQNFGLPVHYYVKLNFNGFVRIIDALGGIEVDVAETLHDENYPTPDYGVTTIHIEAGRQHFSGEEALIYARSRYSTSDFDRARRQQEILTAIRRRLLQPGAWIRLPAVAAALVDAVETDMPPTEWIALGAVFLRAGDVERAVIGPNEVTPFMTETGGQVLLPRWEMINPILARLFES